MRKEDFINVAQIFKVLSCRHRIEIILLLSEGPKCVCEIAKNFNIDITTISRHLKFLLKAGIVSYRKEGNKVIYRLEKEYIKECIFLLLDKSKEE